MRFTPQQFQGMKRRGERIPMLTAYDYQMARLIDEIGVPLVLVGDSLGMVVLGYENTVSVTIEDILHHTRPVVRGTTRALVVADLPFMSYQIGADDALRNAGRLLKEGGAQAVKLEGGQPVAETVRRLVESGIPVQGHLGLTPQSVLQLGGYRVQGKTTAAAQRLLDDAQSLEQAGAFSIVLELIPAPLAKEITASLRIPTIGIGAGPYCDGQVQVLYDALGLIPDFVPRHARPYAQLAEIIRQSLRQYVADVQAQRFPGPAESTGLADNLTMGETEEQ